MPGIKIGDLSSGQEVLKLPMILPRYFKKCFSGHVENQTEFHSSLTLLIPPGVFFLMSVQKHLCKMNAVAQARLLQHVELDAARGSAAGHGGSWQAGNSRALFLGS